MTRLSRGGLGAGEAAEGGWTRTLVPGDQLLWAIREKVCGMRRNSAGAIWGNEFQ